MSTDSLSEHHARRSFWRQTGIWAGLVSGLALLLLLITLTGGFSQGAEPYKGPLVQPGKQIKTRFWEITVHRADYVKTATGGELRIWLTVVNNQTEAKVGLTRNGLVVRLANGPVMLSSYCSPDVGASFQPLLSTPAVCEFSFNANEVAAPTDGKPLRFQLIVLDQRMSVSYIDAPAPEAGGPAGWLDMTAEETESEH